MANPIFKAMNVHSPKASSLVQGGVAYDVPRENIDPHLKTQALSTQEINFTKISGANINVSQLSGNVGYFNKLGVNKVNSSSTIPIDVLTDNGGQGFRIEMTTATDKSFSTFTTSDGFTRFSFDGNGKMLFGSGSGAGDTNLYRNSANILRTDDDFIANRLSAATLEATNGFTGAGAFLTFVISGGIIISAA